MTTEPTAKRSQPDDKPESTEFAEEACAAASSTNSDQGGRQRGQRKARKSKRQRKAEQAPRERLNFEVAKENELFQRVYSGNGVIPQEEQEAFFAILRDSLPTAFRITMTCKFAPVLRRQLAQFTDTLAGQTVDNKQRDGPRQMSWGPDLWHYEVPPPVLKKHRQEPVHSFHRWLVNQSETGTVSRQELVSMIPPLLLDVRSDHLVLDMCAAPGSKSKQIVELMMRDAIDKSEFPIATGCLIANDSDRYRCTTLVGALKTLNSPNWIVTQHAAQYFPIFKPPRDAASSSTASFLQFDRVLADVPCSGDGTLRKNPDLWSKWNPRLPLGQHMLQINIAMRGVALLKEGGRMVYSTCSLNPVEDEAVVCELLRRTKGALRLVDCSASLPNLRRRQGIRTWKLLDESTMEFFDEYSAYGQQEREVSPKKPIPESAFPPTVEEADSFHIERCLRIFPHDQNTGGFFVAVLEKIAPFSDLVTASTTASAPDASNTTAAAAASSSSSSSPSAASSSESAGAVEADGQEEEEQEDDTAAADSEGTTTQLSAAGWQTKKRGIEEPYIPFVSLPSFADIKQTLMDFYGLGEDFPWLRLVVRSVDNPRNVTLVSPGAEQLLRADRRGIMRIINTGLLVFSYVNNFCKLENIHYRINADGAEVIAFYQTKRHLVVPYEEFRAIVLYEKSEYPFESLSAETRAALAAFTVGPVTLRVTAPEDIVDPACPPISVGAWRGSGTVRLMVDQVLKQNLVYAFK